MGETNQRHDTIVLLDNFGVDSERLATSFQLSKTAADLAVIEDDGFLPEGVTSIFGSFLGQEVKRRGPLYFNEVPVPKHWEIKGTNASASVFDKNQLRARIYYSKDAVLREVRVVDWMDDRGMVRFSDHYNRYGRLYARTIFNKKEQKVNKSYFSVDGREILMENYVTKDIILNEDDIVRIFHNRTEFVQYYLFKNGYENSQLIINSLSTPFFVSQAMSGRSKKDILFWQEEAREDIPGNMQMILQGESNTGHIYVQKRGAFEKFMELGVNPDLMSPQGFVYPFEKENQGKKEALICTNSDQIAELETLVKQLPDMRFHIVAVTEMSSKLLNIGKYENVMLYPNVRRDVAKELFNQCDYYLDINYEREIMDALYKAFLHRQLILGYADTLHNRNYIAKGAICPPKAVDQLVAILRKCMEDDHKLKEMLEAQYGESMTERELKLY